MLSIGMWGVEAVVVVYGLIFVIDMKGVFNIPDVRTGNSPFFVSLESEVSKLPLLLKIEGF